MEVLDGQFQKCLSASDLWEYTKAKYHILLATCLSSNIYES